MAMEVVTPPRRTVRPSTATTNVMLDYTETATGLAGSPVLRPMSTTAHPALSPNEVTTGTPPSGLRFRDTNAGHALGGGLTLGVASSPTKLARSPHAARGLGLGLAASNVSIVEYLKSPERFPLSNQLDLATLNPGAAALRRSREHNKENDEQGGVAREGKSQIFSPKPSTAAGVPRPVGTKPSAIPQFYFPKVAIKPTEAQLEHRRTVLARTRPLFKDGLRVNEFDSVAAACDLTRFMSRPLFNAIDTQGRGVVTHVQFARFWKQFSEAQGDDVASCVFALLTPTDTLLPQHLVPLVRDIADRHQSLSLLKDTPVFKDKYVETVIIRVFYNLDRGRTGKIQRKQFCESNFVATLKAVDDSTDINLIFEYFSYKHFYVLYCRFWELDTDHDGIITKRELAGHDQNALSNRIIDRVVVGAGRLDHRSVPLGGGSALSVRAAAGQMTFEDFVWFLLSEEDKSTPTAIEYWFRCLDMDGDGVLSLFELEYFYEEQQSRLQLVSMESLALRDTLCQILDLVHPSASLSITLADLRRCQLAPLFFDTLFNVAKFVIRETKHPSAIREERSRPKMTDWVRFAEEEYNQMAIEHAAEDEDSVGEMDPDADISLMEISDPLSPRSSRAAAVGAGQQSLLDDTPALRRDRY